METVVVFLLNSGEFGYRADTSLGLAGSGIPRMPKKGYESVQWLTSGEFSKAPTFRADESGR